MRLQALALQNFRSFSHWSHQLHKDVTVILGNNATGKTSILEAVMLLATGDSFRAQKIDEMVSFNHEYGRVKGKIHLSSEENIEVEILLTRGLVQQKKVQKRLYTVNGVRRRKRDAVGKLLAVAFRPEDMRLIEGSKGRRRSFLDSPLSMIYLEYALALKEYEQALRRRNKLLLAVREREQPRTVLTYWNTILLQHGTVIQKCRQEFLSFSNTVDFSLPFTVSYEPSLLTKERQEEYAHKEIASGHTLIGPHKDDFVVYAPVVRNHESKNVAIYGSRGQQRLVVLWLKYGELLFLESKTQQKPLLLLDDIMSELDETSEEFVLKTVEDYQSLITTTEPTVYERIEAKLSKGAIELYKM